MASGLKLVAVALGLPGLDVHDTDGPGPHSDPNRGQGLEQICKATSGTDGLWGKVLAVTACLVFRVTHMVGFIF